MCNETVSVSLENLLFSLGIVTFSRLSYRYIVGTSLKTVIKIVDIIHILSLSLSFSHYLSLCHSFFLSFYLSHLFFFSFPVSPSLPFYKSHWITYSSVERGRCLQSSEHLRGIILCTTLAIAVCNKTWTEKRSPRSFYLSLYFCISIVFRYGDPYIVIRIFDLLSLFLPLLLLLLRFVLHLSFLFFLFFVFFLRAFRLCIVIITPTIIYFFRLIKIGPGSFFFFFFYYNSLIPAVFGRWIFRNDLTILPFPAVRSHGTAQYMLRINRPMVYWRFYFSAIRTDHNVPLSYIWLTKQLSKRI